MNDARRGISLTELLVVMSTSTVALLASIGLLRQAMTQQKLADLQCRVHRQAERLALQFRHDVHASNSIRRENSTTDDESDSRWVLSIAEPGDAPVEVRYEIRGGEVIRTSMPMEAQNQKHRESYRFGESAVIEIHRVASPDRMQLRVKRHRLPIAFRNNKERAFVKKPPSQTIVNIESVIGKHLRFGPTGSNAIGDQE